MDTKKPSKKPAKKPTAAKAKQGPRPPGGAARWVRACLELCGGSFEAPIRCKTWREAFTRLEAARADFVRDTTRKAGSHEADARWAPPPTLPFGAETWTRREPPDALRVAFERCGLLFPDLVDGAGDPQSDNFPVAVAVYDRDWDAVEADDDACSYVLGKAGAGNAALAESLYKDMDTTFYEAKAFNQDLSGWRVDSCVEIKFTAPSLNRRVDLHAVDAKPARWRGDVGSSPLDGASAATSSLRNDLVKNYRVHPTHWLISTQVNSVTSMSAMFLSAKAFDQDLGWCVDDGVDLDRAFSSTSCASTSCGVTQVDDLENCPTPSPSKSPTTLAPTTSPAPTAAPTTAAPSVSPAPTARPTSWEERLNRERNEGIGLVLAVVACLACSVCVLLAVSSCFVGSARFAKRKTTPGAALPTALPKPVPSAPAAPRVPSAPPPPPKTHTCRNCGATFRSRNALFRHLRDEKCGQVPRATAPPPPPPSAFLVTCPHGAGPGSHLRVRAPTTGQEMTVIVPRGIRAGGRFAVPLPSGPSRPQARAIPTK